MSFCDEDDGLTVDSNGCFTCVEVPKVKGRFGLAWVSESPECPRPEPVGWQVEFLDTPSKVEQKCREMVKWINCPPLPRCEPCPPDELCCPSNPPRCNPCAPKTNPCRAKCPTKCTCKKPPQPCDHQTQQHHQHQQIQHQQQLLLQHHQQQQHQAKHELQCCCDKQKRREKKCCCCCGQGREGSRQKQLPKRNCYPQMGGTCCRPRSPKRKSPMRCTCEIASVPKCTCDDAPVKDTNGAIGSSSGTYTKKATNHNTTTLYPCFLKQVTLTDRFAHCCTCSKETVTLYQNRNDDHFNTDTDYSHDDNKQHPESAKQQQHHHHHHQELLPKTSQQHLPQHEEHRPVPEHTEPKSKQEPQHEPKEHPKQEPKEHPKQEPKEHRHSHAHPDHAEQHETKDAALVKEHVIKEPIKDNLHEHDKMSESAKKDKEHAIEEVKEHEKTKQSDKVQEHAIEQSHYHDHDEVGKGEKGDDHSVGPKKVPSRMESIKSVHTVQHEQPTIKPDDTIADADPISSNTSTEVVEEDLVKVEKSEDVESEAKHPLAIEPYAETSSFEELLQPLAEHNHKNKHFKPAWISPILMRLCFKAKGHTKKVPPKEEPLVKSVHENEEMEVINKD